MDEGGRPHLWGRERRYMITELLWEHGPMSVAELAATLAADGWQVGGRPSKTISDALRWEIAHGRVVRLGRGLYGPGRMPKQTKSWIRCRNRRTRLEAQEELVAARQVAQLKAPTSRSTWDQLAGVLADRSQGSSCEPAAQTGITIPPPPTGAQPATTTPTRTSRKPRSLDEEVVVLGAGWSEADDAADDEAARQRFLAARRHHRRT